MKKNLILLFTGIALVILVGSCRKVERDSITPTFPNDLIIHSSGNKTIMINDSTVTEKTTESNYDGEAGTGIIIVSWTWTFTEPGGLVTVKTGKEVSYRFQSLGYGSVKLVGIDQYGQVHQSISPTRVVADISQVNPVTNWISTSLSTGVWQENWAINKRTMMWNGTYGYIGTVTSPVWTLTNLLPADTNYLLINGNLVPVTGSNGTQISIKPIVSPSVYPTHDQMGVVKTTSQGVQIWADLTGSKWVSLANPTLILSSLRSDGTVVPDATGGSDGPGDIGDNVVRFTMLHDSLITYFNNNGPAGSNIPFYIWGNPDGTWGVPTDQMPVADYPNWGKFEIPYTWLPSTGLLILNFGSNIYVPTYLNSNRSTSDYWDGFSGALRIIIKVVNTLDKSGEIVPIRQLSSPHLRIIQN